MHAVIFSVLVALFYAVLIRNTHKRDRHSLHWSGPPSVLVSNTHNCSCLFFFFLFFLGGGVFISFFFSQLFPNICLMHEQVIAISGV